MSQKTSLSTLTDAERRLLKAEQQRLIDYLEEVAYEKRCNSGRSLALKLQIKPPSMVDYLRGQVAPLEIKSEYQQLLAAARGWSVERFQAYLRGESPDPGLKAEQYLTATRSVPLELLAEAMVVAAQRFSEMLKAPAHSSLPQANVILSQMLQQRQQELGMDDEQFLAYCEALRLESRDFQGIFAGDYIQNGLLAPLAKVLNTTIDELVNLRDSENLAKAPHPREMGLRSNSLKHSTEV